MAEARQSGNEIRALLQDTVENEGGGIRFGVSEVEVAELVQRPCAALTAGRLGIGGHRHGGNSAVGVAVELAQVRSPGIGRKPGSEREHRVGGFYGLLVFAQFYEGIHQRAHREGVLRIAL